MKINLIIICYGMAICLAQANDLPREPSKEARFLVQGCPDGFSDTAYIDEWRNTVRSKNGVTDDLLLMIDQEKDWELMGNIFLTLRERPDLTTEMLESIKEPLNGILSKDPRSDMLASSYAYGVIGLMENFPSKENERLLLKILDMYDGYYNNAIIQSLAEIGTAESLPSLEKIQKEMGILSGGRGEPAKLKHAIQNIKKRISFKDKIPEVGKIHKENPSDSKNFSDNISTESNLKSNQTSLPSIHINQSNKLLIFISISFGVIILIFLFVRYLK